MRKIILPIDETLSNKFWQEYEKSPINATNYLYKIFKINNYINNVENLNYIYKSKYGNFNITTKLLKNEINDYVNNNIIKINLKNEDYFLKYSIRPYFNEDSILFKEEKKELNKDIFYKLLKFIEIFPHYFIAYSNKEDKYQSGYYNFAINDAKISTKYNFQNYKEVESGILNWPLSTIRLVSKNKEQLVNLAENILNNWLSYNDYLNDIKAFTNNINHNNYIIIVRKEKENFIFDLVLKNDLFNIEKFKKDFDYFFIEKEELEIIENMGFAIFLKKINSDIEELEQLLMSIRNVKECIEIIQENPELKKYTSWLENNFNDSILEEKYFLDELIKEKIAFTYELLLENHGVFKNNEIGRKGFLKFLNKIT